jgi:precorrin-6B methylase 2
MTAATPAVWTTEPFRLGTPQEFARVRELFVRVGFEETPICARAGVPNIHELPGFEQRSVFKEATDAQSLFVRLFIDGDRMPWSTVREILPENDLDALRALGLLHDASAGADDCAATVGVFPIEELFIASDRRRDFDSTGSVPPSDLVFSPMTRETYRFLRLMPRESCDHLLDLCTGTGIAGLVAASQFARRVTLVDVAERSVRFGEFNVALNDLSNVRVLHGDVYAPVAGERFETIVAHPPYVPALETEFVFRDGGEDGESVTRQILAGASEHLEAGGQLLCECMLSDRLSAPVEQRVREMLGDASDDFDVVFGQWRSANPLHFMADLAGSGYPAFDGMSRWGEVFKRLEIEQLVFGTVLLQRRATPRPVVTTRRALSPLTRAADLQWLLRWLVATVDWSEDSARRLLSSRPRTVPRTQLRSRSTVQEGQWAVEECQLVTLAPFAVEATCPSWYATLLQFCDGRMTAREHLQYLRDTRAVPDTAPEDVFAVMIRQLVDAGFIEVDEFRLPDATAMRDSVGDRERASSSGPVQRAD